jgi:hypothetical protein
MQGKVEDARRKALGEKLKAMFRSLERRPVPEALRDVVDQLEPGAPPARQAKKA